MSVPSALRTDLLFDPESRPIIERAFGVQASGGYAHLPGVVSRKKQLLPYLLHCLAALPSA